MQIKKISEQIYSLNSGQLSIKFSKEKFEDLYYAVPVSNTAFLRLLQDNICANTEERLKLNEMMQTSGDKIQILDTLQKQIQGMKL